LILPLIPDYCHTSPIFDLQGSFKYIFLGRVNDNSLPKKNDGFALIHYPKPGFDPSDNNVNIKLIVDKHENKFLFAECKWDFIDILFNFLTYTSRFVCQSKMDTTIILFSFLTYMYMIFYGTIFIVYHFLRQSKMNTTIIIWDVSIFHKGFSLILSLIVHFKSLKC
jgi:Protein of unknown function (DUF674)